MYEYNNWIRDCSDKELLENALKRAFPPAEGSSEQFSRLLDQLRDLERKPEEGDQPPRAT